MRNKVLIRVYVSQIDETYELYIPINETIHTILDSVLKLVNDLLECDLNSDNNRVLIDPENLSIYSENSLVRDTNIRNSKLIILI